LAFGGEPSLKRLKKVKDVEHMLLLAQLEPMQHWEFPAFDRAANSRGSSGRNRDTVS
jgi:hypothetical protein